MLESSVGWSLTKIAVFVAICIVTMNYVPPVVYDCMCLAVLAIQYMSASCIDRRIKICGRTWKLKTGEELRFDVHLHYTMNVKHDICRTRLISFLDRVFAKGSYNREQNTLDKETINARFVKHMEHMDYMGKVNECRLYISDIVV